MITECAPATTSPPQLSDSGDSSPPATATIPPILPSAPPKPSELFSDASAPSAVATPDAIIIRTRFVRVNPDRVAEMEGPPTSTKILSLNLFPDATYDAVPERVEPNPNGFTWYGHSEGDAKSQVTLVFNQGVLAGSIRVAGKFYQVRYVGDQVYAIREINPKALPPD